MTKPNWKSIKVSRRCIGAEGLTSYHRCKAVYRGQGTGWDFVAVRPFEGWVCSRCRNRFVEMFSGPGLPKPLVPVK